MFGKGGRRDGGKNAGRKSDAAHDEEPDIFADERERKDEIELTAWKKALKNTRKWKVLVILFVCTGILAPLISVHSVNVLNEMGDYLTEKYREANGDKPGRQAALQAVNSWLNGDAGAFRSGYANLWWDNATEVGTSTSDDSTGATTHYWSHRLSLTDKSDGSTRDITQLVAVTDGIATAVGTPTVLPKPVSQNSSTDSYRPSGYVQLDQTTSLTNVLDAWGKAYIGKDSNALTVLIGDPNTGHAYQPASLGTFQNASLDWLVRCTRDGGKTDEKDKNDTPEWAAAGITISFKPYAKQTTADSTDADQSDDTNSSVSTSITVLVHNPTRGSAKVVDWGAEGSLTTLKPYGNAIDRSLLQSSTDDGEDADDSEDSGKADDSGDGSAKADSSKTDTGNADAGASASSDSITGDPNEGPND